MHKFDYSFLKNGVLPANLVNTTSSIASLKTMASFRKESHQDIFTELESIAKVQSVKSSNAIEGIITSDDRIAQIVNQNSAPLNHDEAEIAGYRDALSLIHTGYNDIPFSVQSMLSLHRMLLAQVAQSRGGMFKNEDNVILEIDKSGMRKIRFAPVRAVETQKAMEQLEFAYMDAVADESINKLLLITTYMRMDAISMISVLDVNTLSMGLAKMQQSALSTMVVEQPSMSVQRTVRRQRSMFFAPKFCPTKVTQACENELSQ